MVVMHKLCYKEYLIIGFRGKEDPCGGSLRVRKSCAPNFNFVLRLGRRSLGGRYLPINPDRFSSSSIPDAHMLLNRQPGSGLVFLRLALLVDQ